MVAVIGKLNPLKEIFNKLIIPKIVKVEAINKGKELISSLNLDLSHE